MRGVIIFTILAFVGSFFINVDLAIAKKSRVRTVSKQVDYTTVIRKIKDLFKNLKTLKVVYIGSIELDDEGIKDFRGELEIKFPNKYKVTYGNIITICDGKNVYKINKEYGQVLITDYISDEANFFLLLKDLDKNFKKAYFKSTSDTIFLICKSTQQDFYLNKVMLWIEPKKFIPYKIGIIDNAGNKTIYEILELRKNIPLSDNLFNFVNKDSLEIFDLRNKKIEQ